LTARSSRELKLEGGKASCAVLKLAFVSTNRAANQDATSAVRSKVPNVKLNGGSVTHAFKFNAPTSITDVTHKCTVRTGLD